MRPAKRGTKLLVLLLIFAVLVLILVPMIRNWIATRNFRNIESLLGERYEAKEWLEKNQNPAALASNRFESTQKALEFTKLLYEKGAQIVYVTNVDDSEGTIKGEQGPYADTLIVVLPEDKTRRNEIFKIHAVESEGEGYDPEADKGQKELFFWWD